MTYVPPLMTSGSPYSQTRPCPSTSSKTHTLLAGAGSGVTLTNSYEDVISATKQTNHTLIATDAVIHTELASFDIGGFSIIRRGAVLRPPIRVYVNRSTAGAPSNVRIGPFTYLGSQVVCEAAEVGQLVRIDEQCVVSAGARIPDGVWLLPKTLVPGEAVLAPFTVYQGIPACPVEKLNARAHQLLHMEFLRTLRSLAEVKESR
jgi:carbonic anhydrase/acetyltransferase-like protein (isoleucine patch superfamily)